MKRLLLVGALLLIAPASALGSTTRTSVTQEVTGIEHTTVQIRHLSPIHSVKARLLADKAFDAALTQELHRDNPDAEIDLGQREMVLLGLLKKTDSYRKIIFQNLGSQVLGFYDYHNKVLYVRNHANQLFGPRRYTIAHEYTHALQDQHYGLQKLMPNEMPLKYRNSDAVSAHHDLTEGDAWNLQTLFIYRTYSRKDIDALIQLDSQPDHSAPLPKSVYRDFYFPYTTGYEFVHRLYQQGGMAAVDAAYRRLPSSRYEIMHPSAYQKGWRPVDVSLHGVSGFADWKQVDDDVEGAWGYQLLLWQYLPEKSATRITDEWRGDRYIFLEKGNDSMLLMKSVWTSAKAARAAEDGMVSMLRGRYQGHAHVTGGSATTLTETDGAVYLKAVGSRLTVAFAPTVQLAQKLGVAKTS